MGASGDVEKGSALSSKKEKKLKYAFEEEEKPGNKKEDPKDAKKKQVKVHQLFKFADGFDIFLMIIGSICSAAFGCVMPGFSLLFGNLIDAFALPPDQIYDKIKGIALEIVWIGIAVIFAQGMSKMSFMIASERQIKRIRVQYLKSILMQDMGWFDTTGTGELTSRIASDTELILEGIGEKFPQLFVSTASFLFGFILGFVKGWELTLLLLGVTPLLAACMSFVMRILANMSKRGQDAYAKAGAVATEVISSVRTVAAFGGESRELGRYEEKLVDATILGEKKGFWSGLGFGLTMMLLNWSWGGGLTFGAYLIQQGKYTPGGIFTVFFSVLIGAMSLGQASPVMEAIGKAQGAAYKMYETMARPPIIDSTSPEGEKPETVEGHIKFEKIKFRYPSRPEAKIMRGLSLEIKPGQKVALVGHSGCGKSSAIQLLLRFYDPRHGKVTLDGKNIKRLNIKWLRQQMGLVQQEPTLFSGTISENVRYGKESATQQEIEAACKAANAHKFIKELPDGYNTTVGERGVQLSGGQKQRIAIARAIVKNPPILLLDEATSALDTQSEKVVQDALDAVGKGRTTIVIAHRLSTIRDADNIFVFNKGKISEQGTHVELMERNGLYADLVRLQGAGADSSGKQTTTQEQHVADEDVKEIPPLPPRAEEVLPQVSLRRIFALNTKEWPYLSAGTTAAAINGGVNPIFAILMTNMINDYFGPPSGILKSTMKWALAFMGIGIAQLICFIIMAYMFGIAGERLVQRVRYIGFRAIMQKHIGFFDFNEHSTGLLTSHLASDASMVQSLVGQQLANTTMSMFTVITALIIGFYYQWKLTLVILAVSPLIAAANGLRMYGMRGYSFKNQKATAMANQVATEAIAAIRTVESFTNEQKTLDMFDERLEGPQREAIKTSIIQGVLEGFSQGTVFFCMALSWWYGGKLAFDENESFLNIMTVIMSIMLASQSVGGALANVSNASKAKTAASNVFSLVDGVSEINPESEGGEKPSKIVGNFELDNIRFIYPSRPNVVVTDGVTLKIPAGKVTALVGPSGCGKSSIICMLERFYDPVSGEIRLDGLNTKLLNVKWLREQMGLVSQEPVLFAGTIGSNIAYGKIGASQGEIEAAAKAANAHNFITGFPDGYRTEVGERGVQLSGGQKQRIAIARAIIRNPKILLLDEATSALDTESERVVQEALDSVQVGRTTIVIAHRLTTIQKADNIIVIDRGQVVEQGTHEELMAKNGFYHRLVNRQIGK